jgi:hypothetical protein
MNRPDQLEYSLSNFLDTKLETLSVSFMLINLSNKTGDVMRIFVAFVAMAATIPFAI